MKSRLHIVFLLLLVATFLTGCGGPRHNSVTQVATIGALLDGGYDGYMTCGELTAQGGFGLGTFNRLDGEMVVLDGTVYQVKGNGTVSRPAQSVTVPFAMVVPFKQDIELKLTKGVDYERIKTIIDEAVPDKGLFCAIKVRGQFSVMKTRSVPAQDKPYPRLVEVVKHQSVFDLENVSGTIVGFRSPAYVKGGINVPGYHLHFISDDRTSGGHILAFETDRGTMQLDTCNRFVMMVRV